MPQLSGNEPILGLNTNLQTKHKNFNTNININEIHIENVKENLPKYQQSY
jgi:hypothetical protein